MVTDSQNRNSIFGETTSSFTYDTPTKIDVSTIVDDSNEIVPTDEESGTEAKQSELEQVNALGSEDISSDILVGVVGGGIAFILVFVLFISIWLWRRKKRRNEVVRLNAGDTQPWQQLDLSSHPNVTAVDISPDANDPE